MKRNGNGLVMSLIGIGIAASAARWLITPINHPDASDARVAAVLSQFVVGIGALAWGWHRHREDRQSRGPAYDVLTSGVVCLAIGTYLAATALHWLITPIAHPEASTLRAGLVWGQVVIGVGLMAFSRSRLSAAVAT